MKTYKVGGAVRDELLEHPVTESDWVVVGATPEELLQQGYQPVGKDFPVFLHPKTKEEYALARTERKTGRGYTGFQCYNAIDVTLEQDLLRRDLTINAIAMDENGHIIDPYGGQQDLKHRTLRHVSAAFTEDPLRILRVARFAAKLAPYHFKVAKETNELMQQMVRDGELIDLTVERIWKEWQRALDEAEPLRFFEVLADCGALTVLFPDLDIQGCGIHALQLASRLKCETTIRFAVMLYGYKNLERLTQHYKLPNSYTELAKVCQKYATAFLTLDQSQPENVLSLIEQLDGFRKIKRWEQWCKACQICQATVRRTLTLSVQPAKNLRLAFKAASQVNAQGLVARGIKGLAVKKALHDKRLRAISDIFQEGDGYVELDA